MQKCGLVLTHYGILVHSVHAYFLVLLEPVRNLVIQLAIYLSTLKEYVIFLQT